MKTSFERLNLAFRRCLINIENGEGICVVNTIKDLLSKYRGRQKVEMIYSFEKRFVYKDLQREKSDKQACTRCITPKCKKGKEV